MYPEYPEMFYRQMYGFLYNTLGGVALILMYENIFVKALYFTHSACPYKIHRVESSYLVCVMTVIGW